MRALTLEHGPWAYRLDFALHGAAVAGLAVVLLRYGPAAQGPALAIAALLGLLAWSLAEYLLHRFVLHGMQPFKGWHQQHHQRPMALICLPTLVSLGLTLGLVFLPAWWLQGLWKGAAFTLGLAVGYLAYAVVHHATHHWRAQPGWLRRRKRWHALHHREAGSHYGVTTSMWDHLLRSAAQRHTVLPHGARRPGAAEPG